MPDVSGAGSLTRDVRQQITRHMSEDINQEILVEIRKLKWNGSPARNENPACRAPGRFRQFPGAGLKPTGPKGFMNIIRNNPRGTIHECHSKLRNAAAQSGGLP